MRKHEAFQSCLREYDIRGVVDEALTAEDAWHIGRAFGTIIAREGGQRLAIAYDGRLSSPKLVNALEAGALESGMVISRVGRGPTPLLYYSAVKLDSDGAIMVTGSHNPPSYNGFKMVLHGKPFFGAQIQQLGEMIQQQDYISPREGLIEEKPFLFDDYVNRLLEEKKYLPTEIKVVWDAGNGAAGDVIEKLTAQLPGKHITLNTQVDGHFPNHHPDPTVPKNLEQLVEAVSSYQADLGFAFDGDADRIGVVDGQGDILWGDEILLFLARNLLQKHPHKTIISDVKASQILFDGIEKAGGIPLMWKTGHSLIKTKMAETASPLAGEMSGHIFYADRWYGFDDALFAALRILGALRDYGHALSHFKQHLPPTYNTPELRFACDPHRKFKIIENIAQILRKKKANLVDIDGVRVNTSHGWWLLRASNTQPVLVARAESASKRGLETLKGEIAHYLHHEKVEVPATF